MLGQAIGNLLPSAIGVALSPLPIITVILMLGTPKGRSNGVAFALGWVVGLVLVSVIVLLVAGGADDPDSASSDGVNWFQVALGVLFLVMARRQWRSRPRKGEEPQTPTWLAKVDRITPVASAGLGVLLSALNPKNLALTAAAAATIAQAGLSASDDAIAIAVFVAIASVTVVGPVLAYLVAPAKAAGALGHLKEFMADNNAVIVMIVLLLLGAKLLGQGLGGVTA
jgi:threonine/homoserine/homoserine lactone efflux protein